MPEESIAALEQRRAHLCRQLASIGEMRSGSLMARCRRCGKTGCGCAPPGKAQRGPVLSLTRKQSGKTVTRIIPARAAEQAWAEAAEYRRFRRLSQELIEASDALSEARLRAGSRRQRHHRTALLPAQWPLRGLLGATSRLSRLTGPHNLACTLPAATIWRIRDSHSPFLRARARPASGRS